MSKFCGNCGAEMEDAAVVCGNCGAKLESPAKTENKKFTIPGVENLTPQSIALFKKIGIFGGIALVATLVIVIVINIISSSTGTNGLVKDVISAVEEGDAKALAGLYSEQYAEYSDTISSSNKSFEDKIESRLDTLLDHLEDETGAGFSVDYEIRSEKELSERKVKSFNKSFAETVESYNKYASDEKQISFDDEAITEVMDIEVRATATEDGDKEKFKIYIKAVNENGDWKIWDINWSY